MADVDNLWITCALVVFVVLFVASLAQRLKVAPIVPSVRCMSPLHDVVHLLACEAASVARRVSHQPVPPNSLPVATAKSCDVIGFKAPRVGNCRLRIEYGYSHVGTPPQIVVGRQGESSAATADGLIA